MQTINLQDAVDYVMSYHGTMGDKAAVQHCVMVQPMADGSDANMTARVEVLVQPKDKRHKPFTAFWEVWMEYGRPYGEF